MLFHQSIEQKVGFRKVLLSFVALALSMQLLEWFLVMLSPVFRGTGIVLMVGTMFVMGYHFIFYRLASYHYRIIENDVVFERVVGRSNHAFIALKAEDLRLLSQLDLQRVPRRDYFTTSRRGPELMVLAFNWRGKLRTIVIAPNAEFKGALEGIIEGNGVKELKGIKGDSINEVD